MGTHPIFESDFDCLTDAMLFIYLLSWISFILQLCFATLSIAAGLYYVAEIIEEFTAVTEKIIWWMIVLTSGFLVGLWIVEGFPLFMIGVALFSNLVYLGLLRHFPLIELSSPNFLLSLALLAANHVLAFRYFGEEYYPFSEVLAYFTLCVWLIPFTFFVSLSAGDNVLPSYQPYGGQEDVLSHYMTHGKKQRGGLLTILGVVREAIMPSRAKRY